MEIIKATKEEAVKIFEFVKLAIKKMDEQGIFQWDEIYPIQNDFEEDALKNQLYVAKIDGKLAACFTLNKECDEEYKNGAWTYKGLDFCVIHRLCVNPEFQNKGVGKEVCLEIEKILKNNAVKSIKLDCFTENPFSLRLYKKLGYKEVGYADWRKGRFVLMEKNI